MVSPPFRRLVLYTGFILAVVFTLYQLDLLHSTWAPDPLKEKERPPPLHEVQWATMSEHFPVRAFIPLPTGKPASIPAIQHTPKKESSDQKTERLERQAAVKKSFQHAWKGYRKYAWKEDEVAPISGTFITSFGGRAATLVDSLDTLWIMDLNDEFVEAVQALDEIDFSTVDFDTMNLFETTIRYLGGMLGAYDVSGGKYPQLLEKAVLLGDMLYKAFDTPTRMPSTRWDWKNSLYQSQKAPESNLVSEVGSLSLEFTRLSQLTKDPKYFDAIQRISDKFENAQNRTRLPGMWPVTVDTSIESFGDDNLFTLGGMSDSAYEYLPKQHMMLGGRTTQSKVMYETALRVAKENLFFRPLNPKDLDILLSGNVRIMTHEKVDLEPQGQHLSCFLGGMVAVGAKIFDRPNELGMAEKLVNGCIWAYNSMPSGIMPETFHVIPCTKESSCEWDVSLWHDAVYKNSKNSEDGRRLSKEVFVSKRISKGRLMPGFTAVGDRRYILRPELIESVFILYRITGDTHWQDVAWKMFNNIQKLSRTSVANAALDDVTVSYPPKSDRMESFWLAETLKYFYLIFSDTDLVSLDEYVLNTEAHPLKRP